MKAGCRISNFCTFSFHNHTNMTPLNTGADLGASPVPYNERISILDALRGFAILGILLMNIPGFGLPGRVAWDPSVLHEWNSIDYKTWFTVAWIPDGTQRAIFSMLFGAGIVLFTTRQESRVEGVKSADYFFRRQLWLIVFSLIDVYLLLWQGDILFDYACYGMILYVFRRLSPKWLLTAAGICVLFMFARENRDFYLEKRVISRGEIVAAIDTTKTKLTERQKADFAAMQDFKERSTQERKVKSMKKAITQVTGSYEDLYEFRTGNFIDNIIHYTYFSLWDVLAFMFAGMAFFKMGILTGKAPIRIYWLFCILGLGIGLTLSYLYIRPMIDTQFNRFEYVKRVSLQFYDISRCFRTLGLFGLIMLLYRSGWFNWLFELMRPVGQMAFTNYLGQSILCGLYFNGIGLGMYGKLSRHEVYFVVAAVWVIQIIWSHLWLRYFRFGPLEWCWRSLTYWKRQPFRK